MKNLSTVSSVSVMALLSLSPLTALSKPAQENVGPRLETVIVIGEKVERSLKDTTSSVSVISEDVLSTLQHLSITSAVSEVPNVVSLSGAVPDIRGISGNGSAGGFNSISGGAKARVSILIDGVAEPFVADLTGDSGIWDIEQIEVYRGPQSTSNGRNSIGGSIYITTKKPSFEWEGATRLGYRSEEKYVDTALMLSGPLIDNKLAFRISAQHLDGETLTDETEYETNPADYDLNELTSDRLKAKLLWTPTEDFQALLAYSGNKEAGDTGRIYYEGTDPWSYKRIFFRDIEHDSDTFSATFNYRISEGLSLEVLTAVMDYQWGFDSYEASPAREQKLRFEEDNTTLDAKLSIGQAGDTVTGILGLAYFEREQDVVSTGAFPYNGDDESDSKAIYGELTIALNETLNLIAGGRVEKESQTRNFTYLPIISKLEESETFVLPKLALQYELSDDTTLALSGRKGYNAPGGALNFTAQEYYYFDKETVDTYEFSVRSSFADGKVSLGANVFYNNYEGYQALSSTRFIINMDEVVTYGAELELYAQLSQSLVLNAGLGLLETDIKEAGADYAAANGNELNSAPQVTANLGLKYWLTQELHAGASVNYVDDYFGDFNNTDGRVAGGYTLTRVFANYDTGHWSVSAFVNNLLDEEEILTNEPAGGRYPNGYSAIIEPRNMGLSVTYSL